MKFAFVRVRPARKHYSEHENVRDNLMATNASKHEVNQVDTTAQSFTNTIRTELCTTVSDSPMSDHDSDMAKMCSDDESTRLHIHGEFHTRLAEKNDSH